MEESGQIRALAKEIPVGGDNNQGEKRCVPWRKSIPDRPAPALSFI
jgi:hypothetical protein